MNLQMKVLKLKVFAKVKFWRQWSKTFQFLPNLATKIWVLFFENFFGKKYILGILFLLVLIDLILEDKRKDTQVMVAHHICTIFLISFSLGMRFWAIGCLVLFCHDVCDIFLDLSKIFLYIQNRTNCSKSAFIICEIGKTVGFISFVLSWIVFRFHLYPRKAIYAVAYHR